MEQWRQWLHYKLVLKSIYSHDFRFDTWGNTSLAWLVSQLFNLIEIWWAVLWMHYKITLTHFLLTLDLIWFSSCWYVFLTWFVLPWIQLQWRKSGGMENIILLCAWRYGVHTLYVCVRVDNEASQHTVTWCQRSDFVLRLKNTVIHSDQWGGVLLAFSSMCCNYHCVVFFVSVSLNLSVSKLLLLKL